MKLSFKGRNCVVTGASRGIGRATWDWPITKSWKRACLKA